MKKGKFLTISLLLIVFMFSCAKDYRCNCAYKDSSLLYLIPSTTKSDAEARCQEYEDMEEPYELLECELE